MGRNYFWVFWRMLILRNWLSCLISIQHCVQYIDPVDCSRVYLEYAGHIWVTDIFTTVNKVINIDICRSTAYIYFVILSSSSGFLLTGVGGGGWGVGGWLQCLLCPILSWSPTLYNSHTCQFSNVISPSNIRTGAFRRSPVLFVVSFHVFNYYGNVCCILNIC